MIIYSIICKNGDAIPTLQVWCLACRPSPGNQPRGKPDDQAKVSMNVEQAGCPEEPEEALRGGSLEEKEPGGPGGKDCVGFVRSRRGGWLEAGASSEIWTECWGWPLPPLLHSPHLETMTGTWLALPQRLQPWSGLPGGLRPTGLHMCSRCKLCPSLPLFYPLSKWASGKEPVCQCRRCKRHRFNPWVRKIPWRRKWQPLQ